MATAWEQLKAFSALAGGTAWDLLNNPAGTGGTAPPPSWLLTADCGPNQLSVSDISVASASVSDITLTAEVANPSTVTVGNLTTTTETT